MLPSPPQPFVYVDPMTQRRYVLHVRHYDNGHKRMFSYFFAREGKVPKSGVPCPLPEGFEAMPSNVGRYERRKPEKGANIPKGQNRHLKFAAIRGNMPVLRRIRSG